MILIDGNIVLRPIEKTDNELLKRMINDPEMEKNVVGWSFPSSNEVQMNWYDKVIFSKSDARYMIEIDGNTIGMVGLTGIDFKNSTATINIKIGSDEYKNQGIGYRTIMLLVKYAFEELNLHCISASILEYNIASIKLFEKCGFSFEGKRRNRVYKGGKYHNLCDYSILKEEYIK